MNKINKAINLILAIFNQPFKLLNAIVISIKEDYEYLEKIDKK